MLMLERSALKSLYGGQITNINSVDKTKHCVHYCMLWLFSLLLIKTNILYLNLRISFPIYQYKILLRRYLKGTTRKTPCLCGHQVAGERYLE